VLLAILLLETPHEVRDVKKLEDLKNKMISNGWQGRPILTADLGSGNEALTGSHRIRAAKAAGVEVPIVRVSDDIADYADDAGNTIRDAMYFEPDELANFLEKFGDKDAAKLMREEHLAQERGYWKNK
jgi:ParB-like chromosome segregation protein Spo0J